MTILIPIIAALLLSVFTGATGYNIGQKVERSGWQQRELANQKAIVTLDKSRREKNNQIRADRDKRMAQILDERERENAKLRSDINNLSKRGLFVPANKCPSNRDGTPRKADGTEGISGPTDRVRLPQPIESDLISLAQDAQLVVQQYNQCRALLSGEVSVDTLDEKPK